MAFINKEDDCSDRLINRESKYEGLKYGNHNATPVYHIQARSKRKKIVGRIKFGGEPRQMENFLWNFFSPLTDLQGFKWKIGLKIYNFVL